MSRIVLATPFPELEERFRLATGGAFLPLVGPLPTHPGELFTMLRGAPPPDIVALDARPRADGALELATHLDQQFPAIAVLLVTDEPDAVGLLAMRAGVRDIVHPLWEPDQIRTVLDHTIFTTQNRNGVGAVPPPPPPTGRVLSVLSPKGGVGKTTVATNLAVGLARAMPGSTVLVDLDLQFGDVATALDLSPEYSLRDAIDGPAAADTMLLKSYLTQHESGLYVLPAPENPAHADTITGAQISALIHVLATEFPFVVVDTCPGLSEQTLAALDRTTDPILMTAMAVPAIRDLRKLLDTLDGLHMFPELRHIVLNFADPKGGLTVADVEVALGTRVDHALPQSKAALASINMGVPVINAHARDQLAKALARLVDGFLPADARANRKRGRHRSMKLAHR